MILREKVGSSQTWLFELVSNLPSRTLSYKKCYGHINSLRWWQTNATVEKHYGRVSETPCFPGGKITRHLHEL